MFSDIDASQPEKGISRLGSRQGVAFELTAGPFSHFRLASLTIESVFQLDPAIAEIPTRLVQQTLPPNQNNNNNNNDNGDNNNNNNNDDDDDDDEIEQKPTTTTTSTTTTTKKLKIIVFDTSTIPTTTQQSTNPIQPTRQSHWLGNFIVFLVAVMFSGCFIAFASEQYPFEGTRRNFE